MGSPSAGVLQELYDEIKGMKHYSGHERISRVAVLAKIKLRMKTDESPSIPTESEKDKRIAELEEENKHLRANFFTPDEIRKVQEIAYHEGFKACDCGH